MRLAVADELGRADEVHRGFTVDDRSGTVQDVPGHTVGDQDWWWFRTAAEGPVRAELDGWFGQNALETEAPPER